MTFLIAARDLRAIIALSEERHFGRAADRLGMAQPQLSQMIRRIEDAVGMPIFDRRPAVGLTPAGAVIVDAYRRASSELEKGISEARLVAEGRQGIVRLGFSDASMLTELPQVLNRFTRAFPDVRLRLIEGHSQELLGRLLRNDLDLIITRQRQEETGLSSVKLIEDHLVLAVPREHRLAGQRRVRLAGLGGERFLLFRRSAAPAYHDLILQGCRAAGLNPDVVQEVDSRAATLALVGAGFGVTLATRVSERLGYPDVSFCRLQDEMPDVSFWLTCHGGRLTPVAGRLVQYLKSAGV